MAKKGCIYLITNTVNDKVYVGFSTICHKTRFTHHKSESLKNSKTKLHKAMRKFGVDKFKCKVIARHSDREELQCLEREFIEEYNSVVSGYNSNKGGGGGAGGSRSKIKYKGKLYKCHNACARALGLKPVTYRFRITNNISLEAPVGSICNDNYSIKYKNKKYKSITDLGAAFGISNHTAGRRLKKGIPLEEPLGVTNRKGKLVYFNKKPYKSLQHLARVKNVNYDKLYYFTYVKKLSVYKAIKQLNNDCYTQ